LIIIFANPNPHQYPQTFKFKLRQYTIQAIAKIIRLPYVFHSLDAQWLLAFWNVLIQRRNLDRPLMLSTNLQKNDSSPAINGN
jgi:hypothetical protein